jgi:hypothetical protein
LRRDLKYGWTGVWLSPGLLVSAGGVLGLAIAANATIFDLVAGLWFRSLGNAVDAITLASGTAPVQIC